MADVNAVGGYTSKYEMVCHRACDMIHAAQLKAQSMACECMANGGGHPL